MEIKNIRLSKSVLGQEEIDAVTDVLKHEYLGMGIYVKRFEDSLSDFFGRETVLVNTGTTALQLALQGIGLLKDDEVLVQSLTYVACFQAIRAAGGKPVACEVDNKTLTINLDDAASKITPKTKAIMPVHYAGNTGNLQAIYDFAKKHNLRVIEDASHAFGTKYNNQLIGSFGDICCISMDGIKNITSGEGGMVISNDKKVINCVKDIRLLGVKNDTNSRYAGTRSWDFDVTEQGWRCHMSNIMAAIGIVQFSKFPKFKNIRQKYAKIYKRELASFTQVIDCNYDDVVPHIFVIRVDSKRRNNLRTVLEEAGVPTGMHYKPNHLLTLFAYNQDNSTLTQTEQIYKEILTLPLHPELKEHEILYICNIIKNELSK